MNTILISYDLGVPETYIDYINLANHIKSLYSFWARPVKSVWIIKTFDTAEQVRDKLMSILDQNDKLIVVGVTGNWGTYNVSKEVTEWMKTNL